MIFFPPKIPVTPKEAAANRARLRARAIAALYWIAAILPILLALMVYGYSDQAPAWLRAIAIEIDGLFGSPVWSLVGPAGGR